MPKFITILLSLCLLLFLADAAVSLADDSLNLFFGVHPFAVVRVIVFLLATPLTMLVYISMGLTPMIPKRLFLPLTLFGIASQLAMVPCMIYCYNRLQLAVWSISLCQVVLGLVILYCANGRVKFCWPMITAGRLGTRGFSWLNLISFILLNIFVLFPAVVVFLILCASLAVGHFSDGFLALRPHGLTIQVRKYVRNDGKTIELVPMAHVGDAAFYQKLTKSFPTNSIILMEGVSDERNLLTNKISYKRMAAALGLAEQHEEFKPSREQMVRADVDIKQFTTNTISLLNLAMGIHAKGLSPEMAQALVQFPMTPEIEAQLFEDILTKRNQHLVEVIRSRLLESDMLIVPWGAAHMPGIAKEIEKSGFHLSETHDYTVIRFGGVEKLSSGAKP